MPRLIACPGTATLQEISLKEGVNTVGRGDGNDAVISHPSISGRHCEIFVAGDTGQLKDLGSTNGTFINRVPISEATLQSGQRFHLGVVEFLFEGNGVSKAPDGTVGEAANSTPVPGPSPLPAAVGLRLAGRSHEPPTAEAETRNAADSATVEAPPVLDIPVPQSAHCKYHPKSPARWWCAPCQKAYCDLCVTTRPGGAGGQKFCRSCSGPCAMLQIKIEAPQSKSFFKELPRCIVYPFRGSGILILLVATVIFAALDFMSRGILSIVTKAVALGYIFSYVQNIIHSTASDDDRMPDLPGMDDVLSGFFRLLGTILISFGPAMVLAFLAIAQEMPAAGVALIPALIFGCLYFPMAFLAVAIKDNVLAANPLVVVPAILRVPLEYLVAAILSVGIFGFKWVGDVLTASLGHQSLMTSSMTEMFLLFGLRAFWAFLSVYLLTVIVRILGLLYLTKRSRLGW